MRRLLCDCIVVVVVIVVAVGGRRRATASRRRRRRDGTPLVAGTAPMALHQRGEEVDTSQTFPPPAAVGNNDVVTGQRLSIVATSADHSAAAAASVGDNGDYDDEANKPLPRAGTDADGGG